MFSGFTDRTFEFFMAIRFNNNREFFHQNRDWYEEAVRTPLLELSADLAQTIDRLDPSLECRPEKVISRIYRDVRFSKDKSPYRSNMWLAFRRPGSERSTTLGAYFDLSCQGGAYGVGIYSEYRPYMDGLRRRLTVEQDAFLDAWLPVKGRFELLGNRFKRMPLPEGLHEEAARWYPLRGFYVQTTLKDFDLLCSPALTHQLQTGFEALAPLYRFLRETPEIDSL